MSWFLAAVQDAYRSLNRQWHQRIAHWLDRQDEMNVPHGDTVIRAGDKAEVFGAEDRLGEAESCLAS
jgi:Trk K+ transport system NAD-binding subunit